VPTLPTLAVPIRSRRRQRGQFVQKLQHGAAGGVLLFKGLAILQHGPEGTELLIGILEVATSALLIVAMLRAARRLRHGHQTHPHAHGVDWIDIFIAAVLGVEAFERWHADGHIARPTILLALTMLMLGLQHRRIGARADRRRALQVTADGVSLPRRPFGRWSATWPEIAAIRTDARTAVVELRNRRSRSIDLTDTENAREIVEAFEEARRRFEASAPLVQAAPGGLVPEEAPDAKEA